MQIKTTMTPDTCQNDSYHEDSKSVLARIYIGGETCALLVGMEISVSLWKIVMEYLQKIKNIITIQSRNSTSVYLSVENKNTN